MQIGGQFLLLPDQLEHWVVVELSDLCGRMDGKRMGELVARHLIVVRRILVAEGLVDHWEERVGIATHGHCVVTDGHPREGDFVAGAQSTQTELRGVKLNV